MVLCGDTLRPVGDTNLTGRELEQLTRGRIFSADAVSELVTEILPSLQERIPVMIETKRLPRTVQEPPRLVLDVKEEKGALTVLPILVYGDPIIARVDSGRLKIMGGKVPVRDEVAERHLIRRLQNELELIPGRKLRLKGQQAVDFASRLEKLAWGDPRSGARGFLSRARRDAAHRNWRGRPRRLLRIHRRVCWRFGRGLEAPTRLRCSRPGRRKSRWCR